MRRLVAILGLAGSLLVLSAAPALAAIHPIVSSECAAASGSDVANLEDPIGQTPASFDPAEWDQSDLRALLATGVLYWDGGSLQFDPTIKALNGNSGAAHCPNA